jgi:hypothetical protein
MFELYEKWQGLIPLCFGLVITLRAWGIYPRRKKSSKNDKEPFHQFTPAMKVLGPFITIFGLLLLLDILR